jgi:hypothetical protein
MERVCHFSPALRKSMRNTDATWLSQSLWSRFGAKMRQVYSSSSLSNRGLTAFFIRLLHKNVLLSKQITQIANDQIGLGYPLNIDGGTSVDPNGS